jgi:hypothetical protein
MSGFSNPIAGARQLIRSALESVNFVHLVSGWQIKRDGDAEFQELIARGDIDINGGTLTVFDSLGNVLVTIDENGIRVFDSSGNARTRLGIPGAFSSISLFTADANENGSAIVSANAGGSPTDQGRLINQSPDFGRGFMATNLLAPVGLAARTPMWQLITGFLDAGVTQPVVDLCGSPTAGLIARAILDDLWFGVSNGSGVAPAQTRRIGQGLVPGGTSGTLTSNVNGSATVGTVVDIVALLNVPVRAGFKYRVVARGYTGLTNNNAAATNQWDLGIDVDDNGAGRVDVGGFKFNANQAADIRFGVPTYEGEFTAAADGLADIRATITKVVGVNTAFLTTQNDATHPFTVRCYHVG